MSRHKGKNYTPTEYAVTVALNALEAEYRDWAEIEDVYPTVREQKAYKKALAKLHEKLLSSTSMDGMYLDTEIKSREVPAHPDFWAHPDYSR